jgi:hypothetical protein
MIRARWSKVKVGRNDACQCGSGLKYKNCCLRSGPEAYGSKIQTQTVPVVLEGTRTEILSSMIFSGRRFRIVWNRLYHFKPEQTFHEFLDYLVLETLGREWFKKQAEKPRSDQHVISQWRKALQDLVSTPSTTPDGGWVRTGPVDAYLNLAYDLYWLQLIHRLPRSLEKRLRSRDAFQGARYEVLVAATFARAGFEIELLDESIKSVKHCEFVATHKKTGTKVYVEAKSRRRPGVLNQPGTFDPATQAKGDIFRLYAEATQQGPHNNHLYFIFIDANLPVDVPHNAPPYGAMPLDSVPWMKEIETGLRARWNTMAGAAVESAVCITNYAPHFGNDRDAAPIGICSLFSPPNTKAPVRDIEMLDDLVHCLRFYGRIPKQF